MIRATSRFVVRTVMGCLNADDAFKRTGVSLFTSLGLSLHCFIFILAILKVRLRVQRLSNMRDGPFLPVISEQTMVSLGVCDSTYTPHNEQSHLMPSPAIPHTHHDVGPLRLAIATTTNTSDLASFKTWMNHHRGIGVEHFFIRSETPQTSHELQKFTDVTLTSADATGQENVDDRQCHNATNALKESNKMGITHVMHMDDDELLSFPRGFDAFQKHVQGISTPNIHICNYEMLAPHADVVNPFLECHIVQKNNWTFRGYGWGKCIGVVGRTTHSVDPHTFYGCFADTPPDLAVLYHYESLPYTRWLEKTKRYSDGNVQSRLSFVNDSVELFRSNPGEEALKKFWRERCVYSSLAAITS